MILLNRISKLSIYIALFSSLLLSQEAMKNVISTRFKMHVFEDGKPTSFYLVGDLSIYQYAKSYHVDWRDVWIGPVESEKKTILKPEYNSTSDGSISDVIITEDRFSFSIKLTSERVMKVYGRRIMNTDDYFVEGFGVFWIELLQANVKTEWRHVEGSIKLPYCDIF